MAKVLVLSVAFFFVGLASVSAQFLGSDEATTILKSEMQVLEDAMPNATTNAARENIVFKFRYYNAVLTDIHNGNEIGAAIADNAPTDKPRVHSSGLVEFTSDIPNFKVEVTTVVNELSNLLSE